MSKKEADQYSLKRAIVLGRPIYPRDKTDRRTLFNLLSLYFDLQYRTDKSRLDQMEKILMDWAFPKCKCGQHFVRCPPKRSHSSKSSEITSDNAHSRKYQYKTNP